jgi:outer membrane receptor protein involved in Fe transport
MPDPISCSTGYLCTPSTAASNGFDLAAQALPSANVKIGLALAYTDSFYRGALTDTGAVITRRGEATGSLPHVIAPWNVTAWVDYSRALSPDLSTELRREYIFRSRNPGPVQDDDPTSVNYSPGKSPDPATNLVNLRATLHWTSYEAALFVNNAFDAQPTIQRTLYGPVYPPTPATTFRPRTVGLSASWRF